MPAHGAEPTGSGSFVDKDVLDRRGTKVGRTVDVLVDDTTLAPTWLVVDVGLFGAQHYVPAKDASPRDQFLVIPFTKQTVKRAPRAGRVHVVSSELEAALRHHYEAA